MKFSLSQIVVFALMTIFEIVYSAPAPLDNPNAQTSSSSIQPVDGSKISLGPSSGAPINSYPAVSLTFYIPPGYSNIPVGVRASDSVETRPGATTEISVSKGAPNNGLIS